MDLDDKMEKLAFAFLFIIVSAMVAAFVVMMVAGVGGLFTSYAQRDARTRCETIEDAKWSGEACYKNGIKLNFEE